MKQFLKTINASSLKNMPYVKNQNFRHQRQRHQRQRQRHQRQRRRVFFQNFEKILKNFFRA